MLWNPLLLQVATPVCYDQFDNAAEIERLGIGLSIPFTDITQEKLSSALDRVLHDEKFATKMRTLGSALSPWNEMVGPVERSVWWIEHIVNNPGVYSISQFYQKVHKQGPNMVVDRLAPVVGILTIVIVVVRLVIQTAKIKVD